MADLLNAGELISGHYTKLFAQAPAPIAIYKGRELRYVFLNEAYAKIFNHRKILGKTVKEAFPELEGQPYFSILEAVFDTGKPFYGAETPALIDVHNDGVLTTRYYNLVYTPYKNDECVIEGVMAFGHDVTDQVEARKKIEYAEESARLAIESAELGTYEINLLTDEITTSQRFNSIWGVEKNRVNRSELAVTIHPEDLIIRDQAYAKVFETGALFFEVRVWQKDDSYRWVRAKGKLLFDENKKPVRLLGVIQDISEQKRFAEELSRNVEERTKTLQGVNHSLERSNAELEQFAYVASHDLQEPLRKIQVFNTLLLEQPAITELSKSYIEKVSAAASRMAGLIKDLLEYSRLSQVNGLFEKTDLNLLLQNILTDYELMISQKSAKVEIGPLPTIEVSPLQMNQLFFNLVGNALKFTRRNVAPVITIKAEKLTKESKQGFALVHKERDHYLITVSDNGIGFNQEYANKIFTIFQRLNERSMYGGYGIGLALCRKIVTNHSGIIYAKGQLNSGASFHFILPCIQS